MKNKVKISVTATTFKSLSDLKKVKFKDVGEITEYKLWGGSPYFETPIDVTSEGQCIIIEQFDDQQSPRKNMQIRIRKGNQKAVFYNVFITGLIRHGNFRVATHILKEIKDA